MDNIKLGTIFQRVITESNIYIERNDVNGFIKAVWHALSNDIPFIKENVVLYFTPGFKTTAQTESLHKFGTVKEALDKILIIMFEAAQTNTPAGYELMGERLIQLYPGNIDTTTETITSH